MDDNGLHSSKSIYQNLVDKLTSLNLKDLITSIAIILSLGTIHFAFFVESFDVRMLAIVDSSAVSGYFLLLTFISVVSVVMARFIVYYMATLFEAALESRSHKSTHSGFFGSLLFFTLRITGSWEVPYVLALLFFIPLFTGVYMTKHLALIMMLVFLAVLINHFRLVRRFARSKKGSTSSFKFPILLWKKPRKRLYSVLRPDKPWGIIIMITLVSFVAFARAEFVKQKHVFCITESDDLERSEQVCKASIFLSAQNGIFVWDQDRSVALFIPWASGITVEAVEPRRGFLGTPGTIH